MVSSVRQIFLGIKPLSQKSSPYLLVAGTVCVCVLSCQLDSWLTLAFDIWLIYRFFVGFRGLVVSQFHIFTQVQHVIFALIGMRQISKKPVVFAGNDPCKVTPLSVSETARNTPSLRRQKSTARKRHVPCPHGPALQRRCRAFSRFSTCCRRCWSVGVPNSNTLW